MALKNTYPQGRPDMPRAFKQATPSDLNDLDYPARAIMLPTAGAVKITDLEGNATTLASGDLTAGVVYYMPIKKIHDTGTDSGLKIYIWTDE